MTKDYYKSFSSAKWIIIGNIAQKLVNFGLTQALLRTTTPDLYGQAAIQLELFLSTTLFLSREGIRLALLRQLIDDVTSRQQFVNMSWLPSCMIMLFSIPILLLSYDKYVYAMYCLGAAFEAIGEPWVNMNFSQASLRPKLLAETAAIICKSTTLLICLSRYHMGIYGFGIAQVVYGMIYLVVLIISSGYPSLLLPCMTVAQPSINSQALSLAGILSIPLIFKHLLTESDKIALTMIASSYNQGIFAVASNYGALAARILFLPLEDTSRITFSKLSHEVQIADHTSSTHHDAAVEMKRLLVRLLQLTIFVGSIFTIFGISYVRLFVIYALARKWRNDDMILTLQCYCLYLLCMGINGITEAFVHSVTSKDDIYQANLGLILSSIAFFMSSYVLIPYIGTSAVVLANCIAMITRSVNSISFIDAYLTKNTGARSCIWYDIAPDMKICLVMILCAMIVYTSAVHHQQSSMTMRDSMIHLSIGIIVGISYLISYVMFMSHGDRSYIMGYLRMSRHHDKDLKSD